MELDKIFVIAIQKAHLKSFDEGGYIDYEELAKTFVQITKDIAIRYAQFIIDDDPYPYSEDKLKILFDEFLKTI